MSGITNEHRRIALRMLEELEAGGLEVIKVPGRDGGYIRCVFSSTPIGIGDSAGRFLRGASDIQSRAQ
jgi:hypothetical protein